jgi:hypothetical protein
MSDNLIVFSDSDEDSLISIPDQNSIIESEDEEEIIETKKVTRPPDGRKKISTRKLQFEETEKKYKLAEAKAEIKKLSAEWSKNNDYYLKKYQAKHRKDLLSDQDIETMIQYFNDGMDGFESEVNVIIDLIHRKPADSFYTWIETIIDRQEKKFLRLVNQ